MRKIIVQLWLAGIVVLPFHPYAQQANTHHQAVWKTNMDAAKSMEEVVTTLRKIHEANRATGLPQDFHYDIKHWTQQDITAFAKSDKTYDFFESLIGIGNAAVETDKAGKYTNNAFEAQAALTYLKPDGCKSWKGFCNMVANAADETQTTRDRYRKDNEAGKKGAK